MTQRKWVLWGFILAPIVVFYGLLARETINVPFLDDYGGVLGFMCDLSRINTVSGRAMDILTTQHNEYKLIFAEAIYLLQHFLTGYINFSILSTIGNLLVFPIFLVIWFMWTADKRTIRNRLVIFMPVSWILFQLQYYSLLNWPVSSLQNIAVILFSLLTIYALSKDSEKSFYVSLATLLLAISSSGNGFFVIPIGCLLLFQFRRWARLASWLGASVCMAACYFYKYDFLQSQSHADHSIVSSIHHLSAVYSLSFLGASVARYQSILLPAILGFCLCLVFVYAVVDKFYLRNPAMFYSICFILITALAVSGLRSDFGVSQSLVSRYRIYSNLMLVFVYLYVAGRMQWQLRLRHTQLAAAGVIACVAIGFNVVSSYAGFKLLRIRTDLTNEGLRRWEHGEQSITTDPGALDEDPVIRRQRFNGNYEPQDRLLHEAISLHIYEPPAL